MSQAESSSQASSEVTNPPGPLGINAVGGHLIPATDDPAETLGPAETRDPVDLRAVAHPAGDRPAVAPQPRPPAASAPRATASADARPVPPPPPPRSTLPPVRSSADRSGNQAIAGAAATSTPSGVGSARMGRWRGEFQSPTSPQQRPPGQSLHDPADPQPDGDLRATDKVSRAAPPWLVSTVLHLIVLLVLALLTTPAGGKIGRIVLSIGQSEQSDAPELAEFSISDNDVELESQWDADSITPVELPSALETINLAETEVLVPEFETGLGEVSAADVRPMFGGRSGAMKEALLKIYGGTPETRNAVRQGLEWLKRNQEKRGGWSMKGPYNDGSHSENDTAATAMALLAFLGDGHTHKAGDYQRQVERGMKFLIKKQDRSGFFARDARSHEQMYAQAQATIAICEMYALTGDSWLRSYAQSAIDFAQRSQSPQGGWRYRPNFDSDTSVTGWFVLALQSALTSGLDVDRSVLYKVNGYLDRAQHFQGAAYSYQPGGVPTAPMTAEGLLCRQYLGWSHDNQNMVTGVSALLDNDPFDIRQSDVYYWYYATQVLHHFGGSPWRQWNEVMRVELPAEQVQSGRERGSWSPQQDDYGGSYGRLYTTCLSIYCLEVYYRHLPLYQTAQTEL